MKISRKNKTDLRISQKQTVQSIISVVKNILEGKVENPFFSAKYIVSEVLGISIPELLIQQENQIPSEKIKIILSAAKRRSKNEPLQYIFAKAYFRNLILKVGKGVLIPRPETELIVDEIVKRLPQNGIVCDIGTGSGAIALAAAAERPDALVYASDISAAAVRYAKENKKINKLKNVFIRQGSLFSPFKNKKFHIIAANLPYIKNSALDKLPCEIRRFEPKIALRGGEDGLCFIKKFFKDAPDYSFKNTFIIAEMAPEQTSKIRSFLKTIPAYKNIIIIRDLSGKKRFVSAFCN